MANTISYIESDSGKTIHAAVGDKISVSLSWKPSSGFMWTEADSVGVIVESIIQEGADPTPGANAVVKFVFRVTAVPGSLVLNYARPWSETTPPVKWFWLNIVAA